MSGPTINVVVVVGGRVVVVVVGLGLAVVVVGLAEPPPEVVDVVAAGAVLPFFMKTTVT